MSGTPVNTNGLLKFLDHLGFISNRNPTNTNDMFPARTGAKWFHIILQFTRTLQYVEDMYLDLKLHI